MINHKKNQSEDRSAVAYATPDTPNRNQINDIDKFERMQSAVQNPEGIEGHELEGDQQVNNLKEEKLGSYLIFKLDERLFKFRGQVIPAGQYEFNFTFQIPEKKVPSSFQFISAEGLSYSVKYSIQVYFNDPRPLMCQSKEI